MKRYIYSILFMMLCLQQVCMAQLSNMTYLRTRTMLEGDRSSYIDKIVYYRDPEKPYQIVLKGMAPSGKSIITYQEYDALGRKSKSWLPIYYKGDYAHLYEFMVAGYRKYYDDSRPYSQSVYGSSSFNRIVEQYGPGDSWSSSPVFTDYLKNTASSPLSCIKYQISDTGTLVSSGTYRPGQLRVTKTTDEDGNVSYTFVDRQEQLLLTRQMKGNEAHDTYYVYDDFDNLLFVLQPMYQENASLEQYAFQYKYDERRRCVEKKLPGAQPVKYVYDQSDNLVFSQDGTQRTSGKWTFYLYDALQRLVVRGECGNTNTASAGAIRVTCTRTNTNSGLGNSGYASDFSLTSPVVHLVNYYDDYNFRSLTGFNNVNFPAATAHKGSLTGSVVTVLESGAKLYSAHYYDSYDHVIKSVRSNLLGGYDTTSTLYTFTGNPKTVTHVHTATGKATQTETYTYTYDHAERLTKVEHTLNGNKITLAANTYDEIGRLTSKSFHGSTSNQLSYTYNIRNWINTISSGGLFNISLSYGYNGNISRLQSRCPGDNKTYGYDFTYDGLSRLTGARSLISGTVSPSYTANYSYDKNGNIKSLQRGGQSSSGLIDNLSFSLSGNQLKAVNDAATLTASNGFEFKDGVKQTTEYTYDANGSMIKDLNKGIEIQYNVLHLPSKVTFSDGSTVSYLYGADGVKLRSIHKLGSTTRTTDYCGNVIYENGTAKHLLTEEGYVSLSDKKYHYYLKDHQGNNRVVTDQNGTAEESNYYYPFGGIFLSTGNAVQPYKYNGKELDAEKGLNLYDYGARHYDAVLGRFTTMDPMAEKYYSTSPYAYCLNNPINAVDKQGKLVIFINGLTFSEREQGSVNYWSADFINRVTTQLNDKHVLYRHGGNSIDWKFRKFVGSLQGSVDAPNLIKYISDKEGNIKETIKIITHSMGTAYAKGYVESILKYFQENGYTNALVTLEADFDPFQAGSLSVNPDVFTQQFTHSKMFNGDYWFLANERQKKIENYYNDRNQGSHAITTFFNDISKLKEGVYIWNGFSWVLEESKK